MLSDGHQLFLKIEIGMIGISITILQKKIEFQRQEIIYANRHTRKLIVIIVI
jgi:hypothetical protein